MKILVTGGAGFIGSNIVDAYIRAGHRVWVVDNESSGHRRQVNPKANYSKLDVRDKTSLARLFKKVRFDIVNHHAAQIDVRRSVEDPRFDAEVNILGTLNLLELSRGSRVKKIIFASSGGTVYGECTRPARERDPEIPQSPYGVSKLATEKYIKAYQSLYGLRYTIFRYSNVYGPRQDPHGEAGVVAIFSNRLLKGQDSFIFGSGRQTRDFVYVGDVARANVLAASKGLNAVINIGTGRETSVRELFRRMARIASWVRPPILKPARAGELNRSVLDHAHARRIIGWTPATSLDQGLEATIDYFADRLK